MAYNGQEWSIMARDGLELPGITWNHHEYPLLIALELPWNCPGIAPELPGIATELPRNRPRIALESPIIAHNHSQMPAKARRGLAWHLAKQVSL